MPARLRRVELVERHREVVPAAAQRVFIARGYAGATLDAMADEAGFSNGVVYSQLGSKPDLFLALVEHRIEQRAAHHPAWMYLSLPQQVSTSMPSRNG